MNPAKVHRTVSGVAIGFLLSLGVLMLLHGTPPTARADPNTLFVSPSGAGLACSQLVPCDLPTALGQAIDDNIVYLSMGIYTGTGGSVITLTRSIHLRGGWDASPAAPIIRDSAAFTTTLDGQGQRRVALVDGSVTPSLDGLQLTNGWTTGQGGGLHAGMGSHTTLSDCHVYSNTAGTHGGGAYFRGNATLTGNRFYGNRAVRNGGGMALINNAGSTLTGNRIYANRAYWGGGIQTYQCDATLTNNVIYSNTAQESGGGANINEADGNHVALTANRFYSNTAVYGGGVMVGNASVTMTGNLIHDNAAAQGGGLWFASAAGTLVNNVVVENQATTDHAAAGIVVSGSDIRMLHTTIARNTGGRVGGILVFDFSGETSAVALTNTILVSHTTGILVDAGQTAVLEATLWGDGEWANGTDWSGAGTIDTGTTNFWGDPAFRDTGAGDYHILATSDAVDAGVDAGVTADIDSHHRPAPDGTLPDIGADEIDQRSVYLALVTRGHVP